MNNTGDLRLVSEASGATEPVTLDEAKLYLGVTNTAEDTLITSQIGVARRIAEAFLSRDIVSKTYQLTFIETLTGILNLYNAPITSVDSVTIDGGTALVEDTGYELRGATDNPVIYLTDALTVFDTTEVGPFRNVVVDYTTTGMTSPLVEDGVKAIVSDLYNKGMVTEMYKTILAPLRKLHI